MAEDDFTNISRKGEHERSGSSSTHLKRDRKALQYLCTEFPTLIHQFAKYRSSRLEGGREELSWSGVGGVE